MQSTVQNRPSSYGVRYKTNPYLQPNQATAAMVFCPSEYVLNLMLSLPARALRMLLILTAHYNPQTGMAHCTKDQMRKVLSGAPCNISHAIGDLVAAELVARGKAMNTYFISPRVFQPIQISF